MFKRIQDMFKKDSIFFCSVGAVFLYFVLRLIYFAYNISPDLPPDEVTHYGIINLFSQVWFFPMNSPDSYAFGLVTNIPFLYYWLMGRVVNLNLFGVDTLYFLRLVNVFLSLLTCVYTLKWLFLFVKDKWCVLFALIVVTNIAMYSFMSASVSYDNFTNLLTIASMYYGHRSIQEKSIQYLCLFIVTVFAGTLTKIAFLPIAFILILIVGIRWFFLWKRNSDIFKKTKSNWSSKSSILLIVAVLSMLSTIVLYGSNIIFYGGLTPKMQQVVDIESCMKSRIFARGWILNEYKNNRLSYMEARKKANFISHDGDKASTFKLLDLHQHHKNQSIELLDRFNYIWSWSDLMVKRLFGIAGHRFLPKSNPVIGVYFLLLFFSLILVFRYFSFSVKDYHIFDSGVVCVFYTFLLMQLVNYSVYKQTYSLGMAMQGRYLLPIVFLFLGLVAHSLSQIKSCFFRYGVIIAVSTFFIWGDFIYFLKHADSYGFLG